MAAEFDMADLWVGRFPSSEGVDTYFHQTYEDDEKPISPFASDMGEWFYDHDFIQHQFCEQPATDLLDILARDPFLSACLSQMISAFLANPLSPFNLIVIAFNIEIEQPVSINRPDRTLDYLGRFERVPKANLEI